MRPLGYRVLLLSILALGVYSAAPPRALAQEEVNAAGRADGEPTTSVHLQTDTDLFWYMLNFQNRQSDKELGLLYNNAAWGSSSPVVLVGGQARLAGMAAATNTEGKYPYLGRFPPDFTGNSATDARVVQANAALAVHATSNINLYAELLFSDVFSFPAFEQGSLQARQVYAVFGDLEASPWYAFIGKKNISFGDMGTLSPFTQSVVWHYFGGLAEGLGAGYASGGFRAALMGINGGRGIRVADSDAKGKLNNLAANLTYEMDPTEETHLQLGGGFLLGTSYDAEEAEHLEPDLVGPYNSAWDLNALVQMGRFTFAGEYVSTVDDWPATGHQVQAYRVEGGYDVTLGQLPGRLSVSWSEGIQGGKSEQFRYNRQLVLGLGVELNRYAMMSLEYVRSTGFAPLMNITTVSDRNVAQDSAIFGLTLVF